MEYGLKKQENQRFPNANRKQKKDQTGGLIRELIGGSAPPGQ